MTSYHDSTFAPQAASTPTRQAPRPTIREHSGMGHCYQDAQREIRRENIRVLIDACGLDPVAVIDLLLTNDGAARNWREAVQA